MFCVFLSARDIQVVRLMTLIADVVYMNQASSRVFEEELLLLKVLLHILESAVVIVLLVKGFKSYELLFCC